MSYDYQIDVWSVGKHNISSVIRLNNAFFNLTWATALYRSAATTIRDSFSNAICPGQNFRNVVTILSEVVCVLAYLAVFPPMWSKMMEEEDSYGFEQTLVSYTLLSKCSVMSHFANNHKHEQIKLDDHSLDVNSTFVSISHWKFFITTMSKRN